MHLVVEDFGVSLGKKSERLLIKQKGQVISETPFRDIEQITIASNGISLSSDVIHECSEYGIQISFLSFSGRPYAKLTSPNLVGTAQTRRQQLLAYLDERGVGLSKAFVEGKIKNQANVLKYFGKYRRASDTAKYQALSAVLTQLDKARADLAGIEGASVDQVRGQLLAVEGRAAHHYWQGIGLLLEGKADFPGRERRGATDPVNSALNYGYGILYNQVWSAVLLAGLDPFAGFLHTDRPGKPSLVLDLVEEFRAQVVDRIIVAMVSKGAEIAMEEDRLAAETLRDLRRRVMERLDAEENYEGKKHRLKSIIQRQARRLAGYLRGDGNYRPFVGGW
ncbi:CRISPR-associated endonuclease Cas1 [Desulforudis sp. DRI-14]|uniref:CRISPR-associated endonuclease Cas1 n=1 Tax=Desulforudis sp. DRI-14 TaxID=3459793 RepID=UPI004043046D